VSPRDLAARLLLASLGVAASAGLGCAPAYDAQTLYGQLQNSDIEVRQDAREKLESIVREGRFEVFLKGAESPIKTYRAPAILDLARMEQPAARAALRRLLGADRRQMIPYNPIRMKPTTEETDSRILVAHLIHQHGEDPEAVKVLLDGAEHQDRDVLTGTCYALGALRDPAAIPFLAMASRHPELEVARAAAQALSTFKSPEALAALKTLLNHPSEEVRGEVLSGLELHEGPEVAEMLEGVALSDPSSELRVSALSQLPRFKDASVIGFLIERLKGGDEPSRQAALASLRSISGQPFGPDPASWSRWWDANRSSFAAGR
jgi:HEAT repeat protein